MSRNRVATSVYTAHTACAVEQHTFSKCPCIPQYTQGILCVYHLYDKQRHVPEIFSVILVATTSFASLTLTLTAFLPFLLTLYGFFTVVECCWDVIALTLLQVEARCCVECVATNAPALIAVPLFSLAVVFASSCNYQRVYYL